MKKVLFTLFLACTAVFFTNNAVAQGTTQPQNGPKIEFNKTVHDYGEVKYGGNGQCTFTFTNTGTEPLIISNAKGSCGCTVPDWPKQPIAPGEKAQITVKYDTNRAGTINKSVTVQSNAVNQPTVILNIKGNVAPKPEGTSPVNNSGAPGN
jgi:hypothetical protein